MDNKAVTDRKKNEYIELLRFVLCMMIFFHHSGHVTGGAVSLLPACGFAADVFYMKDKSQKPWTILILDLIRGGIHPVDFQ